MDIQATMNKSMPNTKINTTSAVKTKTQFHDFVVRETKKDASWQINELMSRIEKQGSKLSQNQSLDNLKNYKRQVKEFMNYVKKKAIKLENREEFNSFGNSRSLQIIKKVDKKLIELTDQILNNESESGLKVLELIGEVKGLLIDIEI